MGGVNERGRCYRCERWIEADSPSNTLCRSCCEAAVLEAGCQYLKRVPVAVEVGVGRTWAETNAQATPFEIDDSGIVTSPEAA